MNNSNEQPLLEFRPSAASIVLAPLRPILICIGGFGILWYFVPPSGSRTAGMAALFSLLLVRVLWQAIWRSCAKFELTTHRARSTVGVFSRFVTEVPLGRIQNTYLSQPFLERLAGVGTVGVASAGTDEVELIWAMIDRPAEVLKAVRSAVDRLGGGDGLGERSGSAVSPAPKRPFVIGLVGGIGAGKSAVAAALAQRGALVLDSDKQAKSMLDTPRVREELVRWWGPGVVSEGAIDRKKVADIVFSNPSERRRLEGLVHPLLKEGRAAALADAARREIAIAVIDAPLLLEAGVDQECDAVVFVDAPLEARLARVQSRGWDQGELDRREKAQLPLAEKRARSRFVVSNHGPREDLQRQVDTLLGEIGRIRSW
ncbi:MAG: dephospho-CoA kinase [Phycisphaerales bacterium]|nr:dephospho-CoA kinase [Planctomycetota bacterium]